MNSYQPVRTCLLLLLIFTFTQCSKDGGNNDNRNIQSQLCSTVTGMEAIYWDLMNGIPRGDIPGGLPVIKTVGGTYSHPVYPLGFTYPAGYTPQTDPTQNSIGVNLIRQDNRSIWRQTTVSLFSAADAQQILNGEINALQQFMGTNAGIQTVCAQQNSASPASGIFQSSSSVLIRFGDFSALIFVSVTNVSGTGSSMINISLSSAPTNEFASEIQNTYLPVAWQLLFTGGGQRDRDGDGYPDDTDGFPDDPTKH